MSVNEDRVQTLMAMFKRRGVVRPAFELYGGVAGLFDYGPVGGRILRRTQEIWLHHWLRLGNIVEINSPTVTPHQVLEASGHVGAFNDHAVQCRSCEAVERADQLLEGHVNNPDALDAAQLDAALSEHAIECPSCSANDWAGSAPMNLMFPTSIGPVGTGRSAFLRPETAQGMFTNYPSIYRHFKQRLPFGAVQVGKGYRNEISPRQGMIRQREFNMAELEYFIDPEAEVNLAEVARNDVLLNLVPDPKGAHAESLSSEMIPALEAGIVRHPVVGHFMLETYRLMIQLGIDPNRMRFRQHEQDEMAHYASDCWDLEIHGCYGWIECVGIAHRGCYDLEAHASASGSMELRAWREHPEPIHVDKTAWVPVQAKIGPAFRGDAKKVIQSLEAIKDAPKSTPFPLTLTNGSVVTIEEDMVESRRVRYTINGEWFTPHVIEPAFGIDRIIWHMMDHSFNQIEKEGESYDIMRLPEDVAPYDAVVLPLFNKDGMSEKAESLFRDICSIPGLVPTIDAFGKSIGRRYARADEIGIPWAITVDHQTMEDETVTVRSRDDQRQIRITIDNLLEQLRFRTLADHFN